MDSARVLNSDGASSFAVTGIIRPADCCIFPLRQGEDSGGRGSAGGTLKQRWLQWLILVCLVSLHKCNLANVISLGWTGRSLRERKLKETVQKITGRELTSPLAETYAISLEDSFQAHLRLSYHIHISEKAVQLNLVSLLSQLQLCQV